MNNPFLTLSDTRRFNKLIDINNNVNNYYYPHSRLYIQSKRELVLLSLMLESMVFQPELYFY